jgi:ribosomal subunit interface protein
MLTIQTIGVEPTQALSEYAEKRFSGIEKYLGGKGSIESVTLVLAKTTNHHRQGSIYRAEVTVMADGKKFFTEAEQGNLYAAIDEVREEIAHAITADRNRYRTLLIRGARSVKKMLKGISKRNPFTSRVEID